MLTFTYCHDHRYRVSLGPDKPLGDLLQKEDGYFDWWPMPSTGYWAAWILRSIADKLDELNKDWDRQVTEALCNVKPEAEFP